MNEKDFKIFVGRDKRCTAQALSYDACINSMIQYFDVNTEVQFIGLFKDQLIKDGIYNREDDAKQSTEFTYTRFLVPYLSNYNGVSLFCDSDFIFNCDVMEILKYFDKNNSVTCVKHEYKECKSKFKMDGKPQEWYPRKNWSSLMLFNNEHEDCKKLIPELISTESARYLHRMEWTTDDKIGEIPKEWNYLVGYYEKKPFSEIKALHYTDGVPWYKNYRNCDYADEWFSSLEQDKHKDFAVCKRYKALNGYKKLLNLK